MLYLHSYRLFDYNLGYICGNEKQTLGLNLGSEQRRVSARTAKSQNLLRAHKERVDISKTHIGRNVWRESKPLLSSAEQKTLDAKPRVTHNKPKRKQGQINCCQLKSKK